ncbi:MAG TPA: hypothetical protein HA345_02205 [Candidatus Thalassarchaeaceae archaeon]|nr:MAG TPA: hypothetical protein D7H94_02200 [Candidatus Poseidoniales archaeon]HIH84203.1 hypothetical protein [Candidatus Thalassarchaeaceae archaeon]
MNMRPMLLSLLLICSTCVGCLSDNSNSEGVTLIVHFEETNGTIVESYVDGNLDSTTGATIRFDFSNTVSENQLVAFGVDLSNDEADLVIHPNEGSIINVEFTEHGIHDLVAYAEDERGYRVHLPIVIRMDLRMDWTDTDTYNPSPLIIDPIPLNEGTSAASIFIDSTVENPNLIENIGGGRDVEITWRLVDQQEDACQNRDEVVSEGETVRWQTIHFNTFEIHELRVDYNEGQDLIDVHQTVIIQYPQLESVPNPEY